MSYYDELCEQLKSSTEGKTVKVAMKQGGAMGRKTVFAIIGSIEHVIDDLEDLSHDDGDKHCIETEAMLHAVKEEFLHNNDVCRTVYAIEEKIIPRTLDTLKRYKTLIEENQKPIWRS